MANKVFYTSIFEKYYKKYSKKYRTLKDEILVLEQQLLKQPTLGTELGGGLYKIRLASKSKNTGKSGGFRVITYLVTEENNEKIINLLILLPKAKLFYMILLHKRRLNYKCKFQKNWKCLQI